MAKVKSELKRPVGRPKKKFDWDKLDLILQFGATYLECEEILGIAESGLKRQIKKKHDCNFEHYRDKKMSRAKQNLRRKQYELAMSGNATMNIWLGKQWLGQSDKQEINNPDGNMKSETVTKVVVLPSNGRGKK